MEVVIHWLNWLLPYLWLEHEDPLGVNQNCLVAWPNILLCSSRMCKSLGKAGTYLCKIPLPPLLLRMSKVEFSSLNTPFMTKHLICSQMGWWPRIQCTRGAPLMNHLVTNWTLGEEKKNLHNLWIVYFTCSERFSKVLQGAH
jgi:hypothetical protein